MMTTERATTDFGTRMKRTREAGGVSLRQIAEVTKISVSALEALERNDISRLPGGIYTRAFVRSYAIEIGVDPEQSVREFLSQFPHESVTAGSPHVPVEDGGELENRRRRRRLALLGVVVAALVSAVFYVVLFRPFDAVEDAAPQVFSGAAAIADVLGEPLTFEVVATGPQTLQVVVDGAGRESREVKAGERLVFRAQREMTLSTSDAGAVQLSINSQPAVPLGKAGEPRTVQVDRRNYGSFLASQ